MSALRVRSPAFGAVVLVLLAAAKAAFLGAHLRYGDLALDYPFAGGDGIEWVSNGLAWAGAPVRTTVRPPLLPWVFALLDRMHALTWFPPLHQLVLPAGAIALYLTLVRWYRPWVAFAAALLPLASVAATGHGLELMADTLAAVLMFGSIALFLAAERKPWSYAGAGLVGAASALTTPAALLLPLPFAAAVAVCRPADVRRPQLWVGAALFALPCLGWSLAKAVLFGSAGGGTARQLGSRAPRLDGVPYYAAALLGLVGLPACALGVWGGVRLVRCHAREARTWVVLGTVALVGGTFVFLYPYRMQRLLLYVLLPLGVPLAEGLTALRRPLLQAVAAAAAVLWAAWPVPGAPAIDSGFMLLPMPGVFAYAGPAAPQLLDASPAAAWRADPIARVLRAEPLRFAGALPPDPARLGAGDVVYLPPIAGPGRYGTQYRLGCFLRRRIQAVSAELYPPDWWGWRESRLVWQGDRYVVFRVPLPLPAQRATLVAFDASDARWQGLRDAPTSAPAALPPRRQLVAVARLARRLNGWLPRGDPFVALLAETPDERLRLLPFLLRTGNVFVLTGDEARRARAEIGRHPSRRLGTPAGVPVLDGQLWGFRTLVVFADGGYSP